MNLTKDNWIDVAKGAGIAMGGAFITYVGAHIGEWNFGVYTPIAVATISVGINYLRKLIYGDNPPPDAPNLPPSDK
jgi:hypothetical protein